MIIKISAGESSKAELLLRQLSKKAPAYDGIQFLVNQPVDRCDWWIVCHLVDCHVMKKQFAILRIQSSFQWSRPIGVALVVFTINSAT